MTHLWVRSEQRDNEKRTPLTPEGAKNLLEQGLRVSVEESPHRILPIAEFKAAGCEIVAQNSWTKAPDNAIILGLKELPEDGTALRHRHIMFGHAFKGQHSGAALLKRFKAGQGTLYDLEYLTDEAGKRVAAFGYWAGYVGAAVSLKCWHAQQQGETCPALTPYQGQEHLLSDLKQDLNAIASHPRPTALVIGALGRVGRGASDLCTAMNLAVTQWDIKETAHGGPFPEILEHDLFFNCILATPEAPVFVDKSALTRARRLSVIGDIACDPDSDYNPIPIYRSATTWAKPALTVADPPRLDVMAIDNLPSLLPLESSQDFAAQLLPWLMKLDKLSAGVWSRAETVFKHKVREV